jgi:hypothetical protein
VSQTNAKSRMPAGLYGSTKHVVGLLVAPNVLGCSTRLALPLAIPLLKRCGTSSCSATESFHPMFAPSTRERWAQNTRFNSNLSSPLATR